MCRARKDGRNLYCKSCIRQKVTASRRALKEYKAARKQFFAARIEIAECEGIAYTANPFRLSPVDQVRNAIKTGAQTQAEIGYETKLSKDEIGDALANLLLWTHEIRTKIVDGTRLYFTVGDDEVIELPQRKPDVLGSYYSTLHKLGPGRKRAVG